MSQTAIERAQEALRAKREAGESVERLDPIQKAAKKPTSLRLAITGKCWSCVGGDADPKPRDRIRNCTCYTCPLYPVRPYQKKAKADADEREEREDDDGE